MQVFRVEVEPLPALASAPSKPYDERSPSGTSPTVVVFPFLSEQGGRGETASASDLLLLPGLLRVPQTFARLFPEARVQPVIPLEKNEDAYVSSDLQRFLQVAWPHLRSCNVLVTHRNFLANEVLRPSSAASAVGSIPNASVVLATVTRLAPPGGRSEQKKIFFVRHCTSHNNVTRLGNHFMTTCATIEALRRLAPHLRDACAGSGGEVLYGSSILPRAILSCISLQRSISRQQLENARLAFQPDTAATNQAVETYVNTHKCRLQEGSFCGGKKGTFTLPPGPSASR